jgi:hypothetical protein
MFGSKTALLLLANGSEESEVVITVDVRKTSRLNLSIVFQHFIKGSSPCWYQSNHCFNRRKS